LYLNKADDKHCSQRFKFVCTRSNMLASCEKGSGRREVQLMHNNELHPGGKLSQDDVKTLLFTAIISLLTKTLFGTEGQSESFHQENANQMQRDGI